MVQASPSADQGTLSLFYSGDVDHTGFDNVAFFDADHISFVADRDDSLHAQHNALDSAWMFDVGQNFCGTGRQPVRWLAQGRLGPGGRGPRISAQQAAIN